MNKQRFIGLINNSVDASSADLKDLEEVLRNFPYCQAAHILFAKASYETDNMLAEKRIRKAAAYSFDRKNLKKIIHQSKYSFKSENKSLTPIQPAPAPENFLEEKVILEDIREESLAESEKINENTSESTNNIKDTPSEENNSSDDLPAPQSLVSEVKDNSEKPTETTNNNLENSEKPKTSTSGITNSQEFFDDLQKNLIDLRKLKYEAARDISSPSKDTPPTTKIPAVMPEKKYAFPEDKILEELSKKEAFKGKNKINIEKFPWEKVEIFLKKEEEKNAFLEKTIIEKNVDNENIVNNDTDLHIQYLEFLEKERKRLDKRQINNIIDKFIKEDPTIPPLSTRNIPEEQEDLSVKSGTESKGLVSENFAKILIKQGKFQKAIDIYTELSLKNPEKSTYFAGLINELKTKNNL